MLTRSDDVNYTVEEIRISKINVIRCPNFVPKKTMNTPMDTLFYIPGTASIEHHRDPTEGVCSHLAHTLNCRVIAIVHRVSLNNQYPIPINDISKVINYYLKEKKEILNGRIGLSGYSAGGLLAIQLCIANAPRQGLPFQYLLLISPATNLSLEIDRNYTDDADFMKPAFFKRMIKEFIPVELRIKSLNYAALPIFSPNQNKSIAFKDFPPTTILYGEKEAIAPEIEAFINLLTDNGIPLHVEKLSGKQHDFHWYDLEQFTVIKNALEEINVGYYHHNNSIKLHVIKHEEMVFFGNAPLLEEQTPVLNLMNRLNIPFEKIDPEIFLFHGEELETELSAYYYHHLHPHYTYRWWFDFEYIDEQYEELRKLLNLKKRSETPSLQEYISNIQIWIDQHIKNDLLIVYQGVDDQEKLMNYALSGSLNIILPKNKGYYDNTRPLHCSQENNDNNIISTIENNRSSDTFILSLKGFYKSHHFIRLPFHQNNLGHLSQNIINLEHINQSILVEFIQEGDKFSHQLQILDENLEVSACYSLLEACEHPTVMAQLAKIPRLMQRLFKSFTAESDESSILNRERLRYALKSQDMDWIIEILSDPEFFSDKKAEINEISIIPSTYVNNELIERAHLQWENWLKNNMSLLEKALEKKKLSPLQTKILRQEILRISGLNDFQFQFDFIEQLMFEIVAAGCNPDQVKITICLLCLEVFNNNNHPKLYKESSKNILDILKLINFYVNRENIRKTLGSFVDMIMKKNNDQNFDDDIFNDGYTKIHAFLVSNIYSPSFFLMIMRTKKHLSILGNHLKEMFNFEKKNSMLIGTYNIEYLKAIEEINTSVVQRFITDLDGLIHFLKPFSVYQRNLWISRFESSWIDMLITDYSSFLDLINFLSSDIEKEYSGLTIDNSILDYVADRIINLIKEFHNKWGSDPIIFVDLFNYIEFDSIKCSILNRISNDFLKKSLFNHNGFDLVIEIYRNASERVQDVLLKTIPKKWIKKEIEYKLQIMGLNDQQITLLSSITITSLRETPLLFAALAETSSLNEQMGLLGNIDCAVTKKAFYEAYTIFKNLNMIDVILSDLNNKSNINYIYNLQNKYSERKQRIYNFASPISKKIDDNVKIEILKICASEVNTSDSLQMFVLMISSLHSFAEVNFPSIAKFWIKNFDNFICLLQMHDRAKIVEAIIYSIEKEQIQQLITTPNDVRLILNIPENQFGVFSCINKIKKHLLRNISEDLIKENIIDYENFKLFIEIFNISDQDVQSAIIDRIDPAWLCMCEHKATLFISMISSIKANIKEDFSRKFGQICMNEYSSFITVLNALKKRHSIISDSQYAIILSLNSDWVKNLEINLDKALKILVLIDHRSRPIFINKIDRGLIAQEIHDAILRFGITQETMSSMIRITIERLVHHPLIYLILDSFLHEESAIKFVQNIDAKFLIEIFNNESNFSSLLRSEKFNSFGISLVHKLKELEPLSDSIKEIIEKILVNERISTKIKTELLSILSVDFIDEILTIARSDRAQEELINQIPREYFYQNQTNKWFMSMMNTLKGDLSKIALIEKTLSLVNNFIEIADELVSAMKELSSERLQLTLIKNLNFNHINLWTSKHISEILNLSATDKVKLIFIAKLDKTIWTSNITSIQSYIETLESLSTEDQKIAFMDKFDAQWLLTHINIHSIPKIAKQLNPGRASYQFIGTFSLEYINEQLNIITKKEPLTLLQDESKSIELIDFSIKQHIFQLISESINSIIYANDFHDKMHPLIITSKQVLHIMTYAIKNMESKGINTNMFLKIDSLYKSVKDNRDAIVKNINKIKLNITDKNKQNDARYKLWTTQLFHLTLALPMTYFALYCMKKFIFDLMKLDQNDFDNIIKLLQHRSEMIENEFNFIEEQLKKIQPENYKTSIITTETETIYVNRNPFNQFFHPSDYLTLELTARKNLVILKQQLNSFIESFIEKIESNALKDQDLIKSPSENKPQRFF